jgi:hypothetical protein
MVGRRIRRFIHSETVLIPFPGETRETEERWRLD